jgi:hypothetical protein
MMDLQSALGPPGPPGGGPAEIPIGGPAGAPEEQNEGGTSLDALDDAEEALQRFIQLDEDEPDRAKASQALKIVLDLKASNQQSNESGDMKSLRRALASGGAQGPPFGG